MEHSLFADGRCASCEDDFTQRWVDARIPYTIGGLALFGAVAGLLIATGLWVKVLYAVIHIPFGGLAIVGFGAAGSIGLVRWIMRAAMRRRFLGEHLPAGGMSVRDGRARQTHAPASRSG